MGCGASKSEFIQVAHPTTIATTTTEKPERRVHFSDPEYVLLKTPGREENGIGHSSTTENKPVFKRVQSPKTPSNSRAANFKMAPPLIPTSPKLIPRKKPRLPEPEVELPSPRPPKTKRKAIIQDTAELKKVDDHALATNTLVPISSYGTFEKIKTESVLPKQESYFFLIVYFNDLFLSILKTPRSMEGSVEILARYLMLPAKRDLEKVRSFYRWITNNIAYDTDSHFLGKKKPVDAESVLRLKRAVSVGYSNLFAGFCRVARIPVKCIFGFAKGFDYNPLETFHELDSTNHCWNAVYVQDDWRFIECSWGAGHLDQNKKFMYSYKEFYFMPDPEDIIWAHFPCLGTDLMESKPWQLLEEPVELTKFNKLIKPLHTAIEWGVQFVSHKNCVLDVWKKVTISVQSGLEQTLGLISAQLIQNDKEVRQHVMILKTSPDKFTVTVRPPTKGKFTLKILGSDDSMATETHALVEYFIRCHEAVPDCQPYPDHFGPWGPVPDIKSLGFSSPVSINPFLVTDDGRVSFSIDTIKCIEAVTRLSYGLGNIADIDDYAMLECSAKAIHVTCHLPREGFYKLKIMSKCDNDDYKQAINYLIECRNTIEPCSPLPKVFKSARELQCRLLEPLDLFVMGRTKTTLRFTSEKIKEATILRQKFVKLNNNEWEAEVISTPPGEKFIVYGSETGAVGSFKSIYEFRTV